MAWDFFMQNVLFNPFQVSGHIQKWIYLNLHTILLHLSQITFQPETTKKLLSADTTSNTRRLFPFPPPPSWIVVATDRPPINKYLDWGGNNTREGGEGVAGAILHCTYVTGAGSLPFTPLFRSIRSFALPHTTYIPCLKHSSSIPAKKSALTNLGAFLLTGGSGRYACCAVQCLWDREKMNPVVSCRDSEEEEEEVPRNAKKRVCLQKFIHPHAKGCKFGCTVYMGPVSDMGICPSSPQPQF